MECEAGKCVACGKLITDAESRIVFHVSQKTKEVTAVFQYHSVYGHPYLDTCAPAINAPYYENGVQIDVFSVQGFTLDVIDGFKRFYNLTSFSAEATEQLEAIRSGYYLVKADELPDPMPRRHSMQAELEANYDAVVRSAIIKFSNAFEKQKEYAYLDGDIICISLVRVCKNTVEKCVMLHYNDGGNRFSRYIPSVCMKHTHNHDLTFLTILKKLCGSKTRDMVETAEFLNGLLDKVADPVAALYKVRVAIETETLNVKGSFETLKSAIADVIAVTASLTREVRRL